LIELKGLRVKWNVKKETDDGAYTIVEELDANGNWVPVGGVQKITIEVDVDTVLPTVKIERVLF